MSELKYLLKNSKDNGIALVIGNGIHRYTQVGDTNSWDNLLISLARSYNINHDKIPTGITLPEFYDYLELKQISQREHKGILQQAFCRSMLEWKPYSHHQYIVAWAKRKNNPILTTNFDTVLANAGNSELLHPKKKRFYFTDYYPWELYYGDGKIDRPDSGYGIWHINGMVRYPRSVKLGLTHYIASTERARGWIYNGDVRLLFSGNIADTWLYTIFHKPLLIFGLALHENEVFFRWLLIERAKYFIEFPEKRQEAWYVYVESESEKSEGKKLFLEAVGIIPVKVGNYDDIYGEHIWI